jgi:KUP system potassium uptake protein
MLCITGCEALYADMGHFGKRPIRLAWYGLVMPALLVNYFGQGALLLADAGALENPFYLMAPAWGRLPLVILATAATVIASQALISAAFSVTRQAIQLGFLPRMTLRHTSTKDVGQIYLPFINWALFILIAVVVGFFGSSSSLSGAYGVAVSIDMSITTVMAFFVLAFGWNLPLPICALMTGAFFVVDVSFLSSNMLKLPSGGWFPLAVGFGMFLLMATWTQGRRIMADAMRRDAIELSEFLDSVFRAPPARVPGTAVFMVPDPSATPRALMHNLKHNKVLHRHNVFVTLRNHDVPWIATEERLELTALGRDCWQVVLHFGFRDDPDVPKALLPIAERGVPLPALDTSYFLSRETVIPRVEGGMSYWREKLFASLHHNAAPAADFLSLPSNRVVELGSQVEI